MPDEFPYDVFLSHSAKDKAVVRAVAERLRQDGLRVWFDEWVLKPGDRNSNLRSSRRESAQTSVRPDQSMSGLTSAATREEEIEERLEHSNFGFRILDFGFAKPGMSANAFGSDWAQLLTHPQPSTLNPQQISAPLNQERRFIPLRLDDAPIKGSLAQFLSINWLPAEEVVEAQIEKLHNLKRPTCGGSSGFFELRSVWPEEGDGGQLHQPLSYRATAR